MFAVLIINNISRNAGRRACIGRAGIFYVRNDYSITLYGIRVPPVWRVNAPTAFLDECDKRRDRRGYLFYLYLCYSTSRFPTPHRLADTERQPTKRARKPSRLPETLTPTSPVWAWTFRVAISASAARPTRRGTPLPVRSTSAERATPWEPRLILSSSKESSPNGRRSKPTTAVVVPRSGCATPSPSSPGIPTLPYCRPTSRKPESPQPVCSRQFPHRSRPGRVHPEPNELPTLLNTEQLWKQRL